MLSRSFPRLLCTVVLALLLCISAACAATFNFPSNLTEVEAYAFYGDQGIQGLVKLPEGVKHIGESAFCGTGAYAFDFPASISSIARQNLYGTHAYAIVRGYYTQITSNALKGVKFIFAPKGSNAQYRASSDAISFVPLEELRIHDGFIYDFYHDTYSLLCPVDATVMQGEVTIPEKINGYPVTTIGCYGFLGCDKLTSVRIPSSIELKTGALDGCSNALVTYYGDLHFTSLTTNRSWAETTASPSVKWTAALSGGMGNITYTWEVLVNGLVIDTYTTSNNYITLNCSTQNLSNVFSMRVTATDAYGNKGVTEGGNVTVYAEGGPVPGRKYRALIIGNQFTGEGDLERPGNYLSAAHMRRVVSSMSKTPYSITLKKDRTASQILSDISYAFGAADSDDISMFIIATHGTSTGKICGVNNSNLTPTQLRNALDKIPGKKILIVEACHSGKLIGKGANETSEDQFARQFNSSFISAFRSNAEEKSNLAASNYYVITAAAGNESSWVYNNGTVMYNHMTYGCGYRLQNDSFLNYLPADANSNSVLTLHEVYTYTNEKVLAIDIQSDGKHYRQHMQVYPLNSSMILFAK